MGTVRRRTGEPGIAHIYRAVLRTSNIIQYYNDLYNAEKGDLHFTPDLAELAYLVTILHDFEEDQIAHGEHTFLGETTVTYDANPGGTNTGLHLRIIEFIREQFNGEKINAKIDIRSDYMPFLQRALQALKSSDVHDSLIMDHLLTHVKELLYADGIPPDAERILLSIIPLLVKCGSDRGDNNDTYFFGATKNGEIHSTYVQQLVRKSNENLQLFNDVELFLTNVNAGTESMCPRSLRTPLEWSKLVLLCLNPNQMYTIPENGGLPVMI